VADETPVAVPAPAAKSSNSGSLIMMVAIVLLSNALGAGATWFFVQRSMAAVIAPGEAGKHGEGKEGKEGKEGEEHVDMAELLEKSAVVPLEPFVVNLADSDVARYLRIKISLMVDDKSKVKEVEENQALQLKVRDVILQTLTKKTSQDLIHDEGKKKLRKEIQDEVGPFFREPKLNDVMFTEFVIQL
jgi:flagellar protein FliL